MSFFMDLKLVLSLIRLRVNLHLKFKLSTQGLILLESLSSFQ